MISISTQLFLISLSTVWSGIMLAIGFTIGKWIISLFERFRAERSDSVKEFMNQIKEKEGEGQCYLRN